MATKVINQDPNNQPLGQTALSSQVKNESNLLQMAAALSRLDKELKTTQGIIAQQDTLVETAPSGKKNDSFTDIMAELAQALQMIEVLMAKAAQNRSKTGSEISDERLHSADQIATDTIAKLKEIAENRSTNDTEKDVMLAFQIAANIVVFLINPAAGIAMALMTIASQTGAFGWASDKLSGLLQTAGMDKMTADIVAKAVILAVVVAISVAFCPETAAEEATAQSSILSKLNPFSWNMRLSMGLMAFFQTLPQLNINQIVEDDKSLTPEEKKRLEMYITIGLMILSILSALAGSAGMSQLANSGRVVVSDASYLGRLKPLLSGLQTPQALSALETVRMTLGGATGFMQVVEGLTVIQQGVLVKELAKFTALTELNNVGMEMLNAIIAQFQKFTAAIQRSHSESDESFVRDVANAEKAIADFLAKATV